MMPDDDLAQRPQSPYVERLRPDAVQPAEPTIALSGLLGDSERAGNRRLYFNRSLDYFVEFRIDDALYTETIPPEQEPFVGLEATRVTLRRDAQVEFTRSVQNRPLDQFDLDVRLGAPSTTAITARARTGDTCPSDCPTCRTDCVVRSQNACDTFLCPGGNLTDENCVLVSLAFAPCTGI